METPLFLQLPQWLLGVLLVAATLAAYGPVWRAGFIWDDDAFLLNNPWIHSAQGLYRFWLTTSAPDYVPLTSTTLWLEWRLWGANPLGYHVVNVLLHCFSALLWWRILARLLPQCRGAAWFAAALFALHPVNVQSVAWITERKNTLAMLFYAVSILAFLRSEDWDGSCGGNEQGRGWYLAAIGAFLLALLSKPAVAPLPLALLGLIWWRRGRVGRTDIARILPFFAAAFLLGLVTIWFQYHRSIGRFIVRDDNLASRAAGAGWAVWFYLSKAIWPVGLNFVYPRWNIVASRMISYVPGLLAAGALFTCWLYQRRWGRGWFFGLGYFVVMLLPVLGFLNIYFMRYSLVADHWQYFAIMGPLAVATVAVASALRAAVRGGESEGFGSRLALVAGGVALAVFGALTWRQCETYANPETLWRATIAGNPSCWLAHYDLGMNFLKSGRANEATTQFQAALNIHPNDPQALDGLGIACFQKGDVDDAIAHYEESLRIDPDSAMTRNNIGFAFIQKGRIDDAIAQLRRSLELQSANLEALNNLGLALCRNGRFDEAIPCFQKALGYDPRNGMTRFNLGTAFLELGRLDEAVTEMEEALKDSPGAADIYENLGSAYLRKGRFMEALDRFRRAVELQPKDAIAHQNLAWVLATCASAGARDGTEAVKHAQEAIRLSGGDDPKILGTLAAAYAEAGRFAEAVQVGERAAHLAQARGQNALANSLKERTALFSKGMPYREPTGQAAPRS